MTDALGRKNQIITFIRDRVNSTRTGSSFKSEDSKYSKIQDYCDTLLDLCNELCNDNIDYYCERIDDTNNILLYSPTTNIRKKYNIICSDIVSFSGTIGVTEVEKDGGVSAHLKYLDMFLDNQGITFLKRFIDTTDVDFSKEKQVVSIYKRMYDGLKEYFETNPIAMYSLMTGIRTAYSLPDEGIVITPEEYGFVTFDNLSSVGLINDVATFTYEVSDEVPNLKIYHEGTKLMHLRTKPDYKSKKFRLRFMIEAGKNFFKIFEKFQEK